MSRNQVILIMTDTQRKDMLSCYNKELNMNTPFLDKIANEGIRYERAYTAQPVCGPARSAIFTGTFPHTNGSFGNSMALSQTTKTIGQRLTKAGVHSAYVGKWHLDGGDYFGEGKCPNGWDKEYWFDMRNYLDLMSEEDRFISRKTKTSFEKEVAPSFTYAHQCSDRAIDFIEKHKDEDYFLVISYDEPHQPFLAPSNYFELFKNRNHNNYGNINVDLKDHPEHIRLWAETVNNNDYSAYELMGCNAYVDKEIGRVVDAIDSFANDACIIYTSDHGSALGAHGLWDKGPAMYEEITNIPFLVKWNKKITPAQVSENPVSHIDIVPTVMDIFDLELPKCLEGKSMLPELINSNIKTNEYVFTEFSRYEVDHDGFGGFQPIRSVTDGRYKLSINLLTTDELYDTKEDPCEMHNLIESESHISIRNKLHDTVLKFMDETRDPFRGYYWERRPWRIDAKPAHWEYTGMTRQRYTEEDEVHQLDYSTGLPITEYVRKK
ncbi:sulfatase-like hydrolase/transferase [Clostridium grantii]|uniref:Uncharacterized sulfatase n=1 Tax=Clostridium grantii DSM 8605 TaxID=1121316 RepID=A0A1M5SZG1_9CLOT|nr:sulfatase-like hydrolase/transferase [Clostridium grantii]SHH43901.1 uncharacterized sulfatase [Clostridium grantii DSM 8605]